MANATCEVVTEIIDGEVTEPTMAKWDWRRSGSEENSVLGWPVSAAGAENRTGIRRSYIMENDEMFVRAYSKDVPSIIELRHRIWDTTYRGIYPDYLIDDFEWDLHSEKELARVNDPAYSVYLIRKGQQNIGYLTIHQADRVILQSLYIVSECQRSGIGLKAFDLVRAYCRKHNVRSFICHCVPENHNARIFYERMGGTVIGEDLSNEESWQNSVTYQFTLV